MKPYIDCKYPYIKDSLVYLPGKFIGDPERTLPLNEVQQLLAMLNVEQHLAELSLFLKEQDGVLTQSGVKKDPNHLIHPSLLSDAYQIMAKNIDKVRSYIKPYLP